MQLREYQHDDCGLLAELFHETVHSVNAQDYSSEQLDAWSPGTVDLQDWDRSLSAHRTIVAVEGSEIIGFGDMDSSGYLDRLFVSKHRQREGVATAICDELERWASGKPIRTRASVTARPFFEQRGYVVVEEVQAIRRGVALTSFLMEKRSR